MTRLFLAAGVAALAIATPSMAKPGGGHGGGHGGGAAAAHGGGGGHSPQASRGGGGGHAAQGSRGGGGRSHGGGMVAVRGGGGGHGRAQPRQQARNVQHGHAQQRQQARNVQHDRAMQRQQARNVQHGRAMQRQQARNVQHGNAQQRQQARNVQHGHAQQHQQARNAQHGQAMQRQQARNFQRQQARGMARQQARNAQRGNGHAQAMQQQQARNLQRQQGQGFMRQQQARMAERQQLRGNRAQQAQDAFAQRGEYRNRYAQAQQRFVERNGINAERAMAFRNADMAFSGGRHGLINGCPPGLWMKGNGCMPPGQAARFVGAPLAQAAGIVGLSALPRALDYYYPATNDYYYRYGDGYLYQVNRQTNLIASLLPLIAGGYVPGEYLPTSYMASYVPNYWGLDSFYPDYGQLCNRYYHGVIYQVDCASGYVEGVVPMYAEGYGVGQMLPSAYNYYNVPMQYREVYYDTPDYGYWYAPGAIYQYDPGTSVITSVAALMSPGFAVGQPLPIGYDAYNVPMAYRATYYDTPSAWYRYNNGYIYQVDPVTQMVTAIVASLLT